MSSELIRNCCPAAHPADPTPCDGPLIVTVLDRANAGADGCGHHGVRLLASIEGARPVGLPDAPAGTAVRMFRAMNDVRPFPWQAEERDRSAGLAELLAELVTTAAGKESGR